MSEVIGIKVGLALPVAEEIPVYIDWPISMWNINPQIGDRYALEIYDVEFKTNGNIACKLRPVKL